MAQATLTVWTFDIAGGADGVRGQVSPGTSALFVLAHDAVPDRVRDAFTDVGHNELILTNLSSEQQSLLGELLQEA